MVLDISFVIIVLVSSYGNIIESRNPCLGVLYNDSTRMILHENGEQVQYLNKEMKEEMCLIDKYPSELKKKVSLITYFRKYMNDHLLKVRKSTF